MRKTLRKIDNQKFHARFKIKFLKKSGISQKTFKNLFYSSAIPVGVMPFVQQMQIIHKTTYKQRTHYLENFSFFYVYIFLCG